jgi:16S rRNA (uracil1498-N3)-methyltransferase
MSAHTFSFYLPSLEAGARSARLCGDEHAHLKRVLRLSPGETVRITNGRGLVVRAALEGVAEKESVARVLEVERDDTPARRLVLALPLLMRAHFDAALSQCVEVGVTEFVPLCAQKCHVRAWTPAQAERATRVAVAAMKQSARGWLPPIREAVDVDGLVASFGAFATVFLADADGASLPADTAAGDVLAVVGPEGGFSERERERLVRSGARPVSVSPPAARTNRGGGAGFPARPPGLDAPGLTRVVLSHRLRRG